LKDAAPGAGKPVNAQPAHDTSHAAPGAGSLIVFDLRKLAGHQLPARPRGGYRGWVLGAGWTEAVALAAAFAVSALGTPAGISGAVLLLPFQVSVLGTPSPAVTPTNLLYNVTSTPGALYRYWRQHQAGGRLALITGTLPGVITGSIIHAELGSRTPRLRPDGLRAPAAPGGSG
jgi:Sulfite exporter TauE/SafE